MQVLQTVLYTFNGTCEENVCYSQELPVLAVIISFILMTLMFDLGVILLRRETRLLSIVTVHGLKNPMKFVYAENTMGVPSKARNAEGVKIISVRDILLYLIV